MATHPIKINGKAYFFYFLIIGMGRATAIFITKTLYIVLL